MPDNVTQTGSGPGAQLGDLSRFDKFFGAAEVPKAPAQEVSPPAAQVAPSTTEQKAEEPKIPADANAAPDPMKAEGGLAAKIRAEREAKAAKAKQESEAQSWREKYEAAQAQLARYNKSDVVADTIGWAEAMQLSREEQAAVGETLLYGLVPDKATADVRIKLMEARQARKEKLAAEEASRREAEAQAARVRETHEQYIEALASSVEALPPGGETFPESEAWFGEDREAYVRSLYATANNLAESARAQGRACDLSFGAVAKVLEEDLAVRAQRVRSRGVAPAVKQNGAPAPDGKQPEERVIVTNRDLGGGSPPRAPATTEAERIQRAMEVAFRTK